MTHVIFEIVIASRRLDEARKGVKTDPLDAGVLCQRLSRYIEGNKSELAVLRVPTKQRCWMSRFFEV